MAKVLKVITTVLVWLFAAIAVSVMIFTLVSVSTFDRANRDIFGYKMFIVLSDSMSKTDFSAGDLVLIKETDPSKLKEGDIIAYTSRDTENFGEIVTHKIRSLTIDEKGNPGFITYGTTTGVDDKTAVTYPYIIGRYTGSIPKLGQFFQFLKTTPGYICCILVPFVILIVLQGLNCIKLFRRYKKEQVDQIQQEREQLESERLESQRVMQELLELKAQLANKDGSQAEAMASNAPLPQAKSVSIDAPAESAEPNATVSPLS